MLQKNANRLGGWNLVDVDALQDYEERMAVLSPEEFEEMVAEWLRCLGWDDVEVQPMSGTRGKTS